MRHSQALSGLTALVSHWLDCYKQAVTAKGGVRSSSLTCPPGASPLYGNQHVEKNCGVLRIKVHALS